MTRMEISCTVQLFLAVNFTNLIKFYIILKIILFFLKKKRMKLQKKRKMEFNHSNCKRFIIYNDIYS